MLWYGYGSLKRRRLSLLGTSGLAAEGELSEAFMSCSCNCCLWQGRLESLGLLWAAACLRALGSGSAFPGHSAAVRSGPSPARCHIVQSSGLTAALTWQRMPLGLGLWKKGLVSLLIDRNWSSRGVAVESFKLIPKLKPLIKSQGKHWSLFVLHQSALWLNQSMAVSNNKRFFLKIQ